MRMFTAVRLLVLFSVMLSACASTARPAADNTGQSVNIQFETDPSPAMKGDTELIFTITDADGTPIEDARVDVSADHTDMTGMAMSGAATDQGGGRYSINANFSMTGNWKLTVFLRNEQGLDHKEEIELEVQ